MLRPGTIVSVHGFTSEDTLWMNNQEGVCERWDKDAGIMSVRLRSGGAPKRIKPTHLRKVRMHDESSMDPDAKRALELFQKWDPDGDGLMGLDEFASVLSTIGLTERVLKCFVETVDKNHDNYVSYDEFLSWSLTPVDTTKLRLDAYWPDGQTADSSSLPTPEAEEAVTHPDEASHDTELTKEGLERIVGPLPAKWPKHGIAAVNNVRIRFPDYPLEKIVQVMAENDFMGGKAVAAIRKTGARENDAIRSGANKS